MISSKKIVIFILSFIFLKIHLLNAQTDTCYIPITSNKQNLGLYGGVNYDLSYSNITSRIFAAFQSPASLFQSDDSGSTWYQSFPNDSLVFDCKTRGWGGRAVRVAVNDSGWIAVRTSMKNLSLTSVVVSFNNGDSGTWKTAIDPSILELFGYSNYSVSGFALNNYVLKAALGPILVDIREAGINPATDIVDLSQIVSGIDTSSQVISIAIANVSSNIPFYMLVDTNANQTNENEIYQRGQRLYKYDGFSFNMLSPPVSIQNNMSRVFLSPNAITGDTVFVTGLDSNNLARIFISLNGGQNWADVSYNGTGTAYELSDVDFSRDWISSLPQSNGTILIGSGINISFDLGNSWNNLNDSNEGEAVINPKSLNFISKMGPRGMLNSSTGYTGAFISASNRYLNSFTVYKNVHSPKKGEFYVSTSYGLVYTTAYLNTNLKEYEKWISPYGIAPVNYGYDSIVTAMAMNPYDSANVVVGCSVGISTSLTGVNGFLSVSVMGYTDSLQVDEIEFVDSLTVIAITTPEDSASVKEGRIWKSVDKGVNWTNITPVGFTYGTALSIGWDANDTSIYIASAKDKNTSIAAALWRSQDKGNNWIKVNDAPGSTVKPLLSHLPIYDIDVDPRSTDTIYLIAGYLDALEAVRSADGGATYTYIAIQEYQDEFDGGNCSVQIYDSLPDNVLFSFSRNIIAYYYPNDSVYIAYTGLIDEVVESLNLGSILVGTTTGFYTLGFDPVIDDIVSVSNFNFEKENIHIYPVPVILSAQLNLENIDTVEPFVHFRVYNALGKSIYTSEEKISQNKLSIPVKKLNIINAGLYFIKVNNQSIPLIVLE